MGFLGAERGAIGIPRHPNEHGEALDEVLPTGWAVWFRLSLSGGDLTGSRV